MWMWWSMAACGGASGEPGAGANGVLDIEVDPADVDFGVVTLGQTASESLVVHNHGTDDVLVVELTTSIPALEVTDFGSPRISAGADETIVVEWTPTDIDDLDASLRLRVGTALDALSDLRVRAVGSVSGADLTPSATSHDMGVVDVGCVATLPLVLTNMGNDELVISSLSLTNDFEFTIDDGAGATPALPIHIAAGLATTIDIVYTPTTDHSADTTLEIGSNDALAPTTNVEVHAEGNIEESNTMTWTVVGKQAITGIIAPNEETSTGAIADDLRDDFLPTFFDALLTSRLPFRIAIVMREDGHVDGDVAYIDDTFSLDDAVDAAKDMLAGHSLYGGDNDQGFQTCLSAIEQNEDWLVGESELWLDSRLNLVVINTDSEQSFGNADYFIAEYDDYKDEANFAVHAIAGDHHSGCTSATLVAVPSEPLYEASIATGGVFISVCDPDWTTTAETLARAFREGIETFVLDGDPAPSSIVVHIDGVEVTTGWSYDAEAQSLLFDDAAYPHSGAELRVDYVMAVTCDE